MNRTKVLNKAAEECIKELYSLAQPHVDWNDFVKECEQYSKRYKTWENFRRAFIRMDKFPQEWEHQKTIHPNWEGKSITECIGPRPYEYYYLPKEVMEDIVEEYIYAYKIDNHKELLDIIHILKNYCKEPIVDKWIDDYDDEYGHHPGYRGFEYADNLEREIFSILKENSNYWKSAIGESNPSDLSKELQDKFFEFLDKAGKFYNWNSELNSFNTNVYLGVSPNNDKEAVIDNWKIYRKQIIKIDDSEYDEYDEE